MNRREIQEYIKHMDENGLRNLCEDIYEWRYVRGTLRPDCFINQLAENIQYWEIREIEDIVLEVGAKRFRNVVLLLLKNRPTDYLK